LARISDNEGMDLTRIVESLLFATDRPLTPKALARALHEAAKNSPVPEGEPPEKVGIEEVEAAIAQLEKQLQADGSSLMVQGVAGGYLLKTRPEFSVWTNKLFDQPKPPRLSQPALETLAVIAYRQPIGRAEIESVRGVAVDGVVATLLERKVIRVAGRSEQPGRPLLYETTPLFLEMFGLKALDELPNADELRRLKPPEIPHVPEQQQLDVGPVPTDETPADAGGSDRPQDCAITPATD
jgi:segregation and condensation protein B